MNSMMMAAGMLVSGLWAAGAWAQPCPQPRDCPPDGCRAACLMLAAAEKAPATQPGLRFRAWTDRGPWPMPGMDMFMREGRKEKAAYLGISTEPAGAALREQLKLPRGVGLAVHFVDPGSPAEKAGVKQHDVLEKLDDQILVNPQQLAVLVRLRKPDDQMTLTLIRQGQRQTVTAKVAEKELPVLDDAPPPWGGWGGGMTMPAMPKFDRLRPATRPGPMRPPMGMGPWPCDGMVSVMVHDGGSEMMWCDGEHTLRLSSREGQDKRLVAMDSSGKTVFDGPVQTPEQRGKLPGEVGAKLRKLEQAATAEPWGPEEK